jgi:GSH-dependent disulfide-bond oxidoreductase
LYGVLDRRLAERPYVAGDEYTIADIAIYPWIVPWQRQQQQLSDTPHLKRWFESIAARPATVRAYERGKAYSSAAPTSEEARKVLFGQTAASVRRAADGAAPKS